jgi:hypothetical protein
MPFSWRRSATRIDVEVIADRVAAVAVARRGPEEWHKMNEASAEFLEVGDLFLEAAEVSCEAVLVDHIDRESRIEVPGTYTLPLEVDRFELVGRRPNFSRRRASSRSK